MPEAARRWAARIALVAIALGVLFALWSIKVKSDRVWPFPRSARFLPGLLEICLWVGVGSVAIFLFVVLLISLWEEATKK